jgi:hypothetical protein
MITRWRAECCQIGAGRREEKSPAHPAYGLLDVIVGLSPGESATVAALFSIIGQPQPSVRACEHSYLRKSIGKLLGHSETIGGDPAVFNGSVHGPPMCAPTISGGQMFDRSDLAWQHQGSAWRSFAIPVSPVLCA